MELEICLVIGNWNLVILNMVIQQYNDPGINRWLKLGYWYTEHKYQFYKALIGGLILLNIPFWLYVSYSMVNIVFLTPDQSVVYEELVRQRTEVSEIHASQAPKPLVIRDTFSVASASESSLNPKFADFIAVVYNPNKEWFMDVMYRFNWEGGSTAMDTSFVLPEQETALTMYGVPVSGLPSQSKIGVISTDWERLKDEIIIARISEMMDAVELADSRVVSDGQSSVVEYSIDNSSVYSFVDPVFLVVLSRFNGEPSAIGFNRALEIPGKGGVGLEHRWLRALPTGLQVSVYPRINFLSNSVYRLPGSDARIQF